MEWTRSGAELRARTTAGAIAAAAQNGTSVAFVRSTRGIEPDVRKSDSTIQSRRSGVLGGQLQYAARPLRWSDLDRLLKQAGAPGPCQISIPKPAFGVIVDHV